MLIGKSKPPKTLGRVSAAVLGMLLYASAHTTLAAAADSAESSRVETSLHGCASDSLTGESSALAAQYPAVAWSTTDHSAPVAASSSDLLARLHYVFGGDFGVLGQRGRPADREVLFRNSDAFARANVGLNPGKEWAGFIYADFGALDSALRWQGLVGIRSGRGVDLLGGWRRVTYRFTPGTGVESLDFNGPFLGATFTW